MRMYKIIIFIGVIFIITAFNKSKPKGISTDLLPPTLNETVTDITVDVNNVIKTLTGNEVGINLNYLMDDAIISGNNSNKTADGLKQMGVKILRYPGGEKSDNYYFSSAPYTSAAPRGITCHFPVNDESQRFINPDLSAKKEVLDFDEFIDVCQKTRAKPLVVVAYDAMYMDSSKCNGKRPTKAQLLENAKQWVKYANIKKSYNVQLWMIGNESYHPLGNGFTTAAQYAKDIAEFADTMRSVDPSIKIIANGAASWWSTLLLSPAAQKIDFLANSNYLPSMSSYDSYRTFNGSLNGETEQAIATLNKVASGPDKDRIQIIESEFNSIDFTSENWKRINNLGHALCSFQMLADGLLIPKLYSSCFWNTRWINNTAKPLDLCDALQANGNLNANGISLSILGNNLLKTMVATTVKNNGVKSYASYNSSNKNLNLFLLNKETLPQKVKISLANYLNSFSFDKWEFKGNNPEDTSPTWSMVANNQKGGLTVELILPATSVTMLTCK